MSNVGWVWIALLSMTAGKTLDLGAFAFDPALTEEKAKAGSASTGRG